MIKVLIVDDSATIREYLRHIIDGDEKLKVVATAKDGEEAVKLVQLKRPDVVSMDIHMPRMDGYEATQKIMELHPVPIVIVSSTMDAKSVEKTFRALQAGALTSLAKPEWFGRPEFNRTAREIVETLKLMSEVKVVRRRPKLRKKETVTAVPAINRIGTASDKIELVAMGASTGGPPVIQSILSSLPKDGFKASVLIVQHIALGFLQGMVDWLHEETGFPIRIPVHGEHIMGGKVYFAPDDHHMGVTAKGKIVLSKAPPEYGVRPSISYLFRSVEDAYGKRAIGVLLTGMGRDGALELKTMKEKGAITLAQDKESSVVHGMPGEAIKLGAAHHVCSPKQIAAFLSSRVNAG